jgi:hypothetical protein
VVDPITEDPSNKLHQQLYQPSQNIAVDERMVKSRNRRDYFLTERELKELKLTVHTSGES